MESKMRAILIDPEAHTVTEVEYNGNYKDIYRHIDCSCFTAISIRSPDGNLSHNGRKNHIFVDDDGLLNDPRYFFIWKGYGQPLANKGLILGCDEAGETIGTTWTVDQVKAMVTFTELSVQGFENIEPHYEEHFGTKFMTIGHRPVFGPPAKTDDTE